MADQNNNNDHNKELMISKYIDMQVMELEIRKREIDAQLVSQDSDKQIALESLKYQKEDRDGDRSSFDKESTKNKIFISVIVFMVLSFISILVFQDAKELAKTLIVDGMKIIFAFIAGYGFAIYKLSSSVSSDEED